jgi:16S rRNA (guanine527-N7)-methyltransferase
MGSVDTAVMDRLLKPYAQLDEQRLRLTSIYIDLLLKWNAKINLTAIRDPEEMVTRHFGESFFAAATLRSQAPLGSVVDLGSGAGFPGIPMAMLAPEARVTLIESSLKKATFLKEVVFALGLKNVTVFSGRGESYPERADLVTMRAVEKFIDALRVAIGLARTGGLVGLLIGASQEQQARAIGTDVAWRGPIPVPGGHSRVLLAGTKVAIVE